jgi:glycyl-tRNA synthetase alpha chain
VDGVFVPEDMRPNGGVPLYLQDLILALHAYWAEAGCYLAQPYDIEKGAGTMNPFTFFRCLGPEPWRVAYVEPSRRPADARYGENPNRLYQHHQYQVILKPSPDDVQDLYLESLVAIGLDPRRHDIRFVEDNWESPTLGAWGLGWEVWCDGMEISQFTYFQQVAGYELDVVPVELTYGLERIAAYVQDKDSVFDVLVRPGLTYRELFLANEAQQSRYGFEAADTAMLWQLFDLYEAESRRLAAEDTWVVAYDYALKCSHVFNLLDARGAIAPSERVRTIARVRELARLAAEGYLRAREAAGFPLLAGGA